nr:RNA polymerase factor sigma-54 [Halovulum dunhuangense]
MSQVRSLRMTPQLRQAIGMLSCDNRDLAAFLRIQAATNPFLEVAPLQEPPHPPVPRAPGSSGGVALSADGVAAPEGSLIAHVLREIGLAFPEGPDRRTALHFAEALEPTGWLGRPLSAIAADAGVTRDRAEAVLARLQQIEPAGLFARDLAECLRLQALDAGDMTQPLAAVLDHLDFIGRGDLAAMGRATGLSREEIMAALGVLRGYDPKPGARFDAPAPPPAPPDLIARREGGDWTVEIDGSGLPCVRLREDDTGAAVLSENERRLLDSARWLERAVEQRNLTVLRVGAELVRRQGRFLVDGPAHMRPMTRRHLADALGLHESTVSRVTSGLSMATPRGTLSLRSFFSVALPSADNAEGVAAAGVRDAIRALIQAEDPAAPLSDRDIAAHFAGQGITLARRTVAKYREVLGIEGSARRRSRAKDMR